MLFGLIYYYEQIPQSKTKYFIKNIFVEEQNLEKYMFIELNKDL